jgi:CheY-like chemotaxis protein
LDEEFCIAHVGVEPGDYVRLSVSDNGCGMSKETLSHLFEPFFTTKGVGKGTGLGLATVYGAVKQNNGYITAYSELGHGTSFAIYLPRYKGRVERAQAAPGEEAAGHGSATVLLVEDEPSILNICKTMLEKLGLTVIAAVTPGEALRLAQTHSGNINLLMTDVVMPEMNGRELAKALLSLYPGVKRLFMSGYTADVIAHHGVLEEGVHFIQKPFTLERLSTKIREVLNSE